MKHERIEVVTTAGSAWLERLSPRQMIAVGDSLWSEHRKRLLQDMKDAEVDSADRMKALQDHDGKRGLMSELVHYAISLQGALEIIATAAKGKNAENANELPDNFVGSAEEGMRIALDLLGAEIGKNDSKTKKKKLKESQDG